MINKEKIFVTRPFLPPLDEFYKYLERIWESKWLTNNGFFHQQLEKELAEFLGIKYISLFTNGTLALMVALQALEITEEVITTPFSFVATTHSLWWNGLKPVFCDIKENTFNIDPEKIEAAITPKTTAIVPVHVYGNPCNVDAIQKIANKYGLKVIYDAAHAFGVKKNNVSILNWGDLSILSFHATKVFNTFEGGAIVCHNESMKRKIDYLKNFGFIGEEEVIAPGINGKMSEFQAALGLLQLKNIKKNIENREKIANYYYSELKNVQGIKCLKIGDDIEWNYAYFPILVEENKYWLSRNGLYNKLKENNIFSRKYFYPLISNLSIYKNLKSAQKDKLPVANKIAEQVLCLPIYPDLDVQKVEEICNIIKKRK